MRSRNPLRGGGTTESETSCLSAGKIIIYLTEVWSDKAFKTKWKSVQMLSQKMAENRLKLRTILIVTEEEKKRSLFDLEIGTF